MTAKSTNTPQLPDELRKIAEQIFDKNFEQSNLIQIAIDEEGHPEHTEALLKSINRLNQDIYELYLKLVGDPDAE